MRKMYTVAAIHGPTAPRDGRKWTRASPSGRKTPQLLPMVTASLA